MEKFFLILKIRTGRIPKAVTRTLIPLPEDLIFRTLIPFIDPQITTNQKMRVLGQCLGSLHGKPAKIKIFRILIRFEKFLFHLTGALTHGHRMESHDIKLSPLRPEKICDTLIRFP